jgi:hypothetical protein
MNEKIAKTYKIIFNPLKNRGIKNKNRINILKHPIFVKFSNFHNSPVFKMNPFAVQGFFSKAANSNFMVKKKPGAGLRAFRIM